MREEDIILVYMTAGSRETAAKLAKSLVEQRLAACVNILGNITSFYRWGGEMHEDEEVALLAKTLAGKLDSLVMEVKRIHEYEVPAIVAVPAAGGNADFLKWVAGEVNPKRNGDL